MTHFAVSGSDIFTMVKYTENAKCDFFRRVSDFFWASKLAKNSPGCWWFRPFIKSTDIRVGCEKYVTWLLMVCLLYYRSTASSTHPKMYKLWCMLCVLRSTASVFYLLLPGKLLWWYSMSHYVCGKFPKYLIICILRALGHIIYALFDH